MDQTEFFHVHEIVEFIRQGDFSERDVFVLLMILREHAKKDFPVIEELANFIAHRERDRGALFKYVQGIKQKIESALPNGESEEFTVFSVYTVKQLQDSLNNLLEKKGLNPISEIAANRIMVCIISLLQDVRLSSDKGRNMVGMFKVGIDPYKLILFGAITIEGIINDKGDPLVVNFPVLEAVNDFQPIKIVEQQKFGYHIESLVWAGTVDGVFGIYNKVFEETPR